MANRLLFITPSYALRTQFTAGTVLVFLAPGAMIPEIAIKVLFLILVLLIFTAAAWFVILSTDERDMVRNHLKMVPTFKE